MINLIPMPKRVDLKGRCFVCDGVFVGTEIQDQRILSAYRKLPQKSDGIPLEIEYGSGKGDEYVLNIDEKFIKITSDGVKGAFYAIQTLRQLFRGECLPVCVIEDKPDFAYRGFYQDITRGKVPKLETLKELIDMMAYYKYNSLQLYVEHTFECEEYADSIERTGCITADEIKELDSCCRENFIDFIPSIATFGHIYELLEKDRYKHLQEAENFRQENHMWHERSIHHTIDPTKKESFDLICGIIDKYMPLFSSEYFNICCDETFDLMKGKHKDEDTAALYVEFVLKIAEYVKAKGKKVMMWGDIILQHEDYISRLPDNMVYLNWSYGKCPPEDKIAALKDKAQIVCPGTNTWHRISECVDISEDNISIMAEYAKKYGAKGILTTNWGDFGNMCSLELAMYGFILGAEKSWSESTKADKDFKCRVNSLLYENENAVDYIFEISRIQSDIDWKAVAYLYSEKVLGYKAAYVLLEKEVVEEAQKACEKILARLKNESKNRFLEEMACAAWGIEVMAELLGLYAGYDINRNTSTEEWLSEYSRLWLLKNKPSELHEIQAVFEGLEKGL